MFRLRIDSHSTAIGPRCDNNYYWKTYGTTGLLHYGLNKYVGQRDCSIAGQRPVLRHCDLNDL